MPMHLKSIAKRVKRPLRFLKGVSLGSKRKGKEIETLQNGVIPEPIYNGQEEERVGNPIEIEVDVTEESVVSHGAPTAVTEKHDVAHPELTIPVAEPVVEDESAALPLSSTVNVEEEVRLQSSMVTDLSVAAGHPEPVAADGTHDSELVPKDEHLPEESAISPGDVTADSISSLSLPEEPAGNHVYDVVDEKEQQSPPVIGNSDTLQVSAAGSLSSMEMNDEDIVETKVDVAPSEALADIDPFLVDDPDDPEFDDEKQSPSLQSPSSPSPAAHQVSLATPASEAGFNLQASADLPPANVPPVNVNKDVPRPPESDSDDEKFPGLFIPGLVIPTMFLPIPNTDPLTTILTKHVPEPHLRPPRDLSGEWKNSDFHTLVMTNNWRALAKMARDRIVATSPGDVDLILSLWYLRLAALARLRLFNQTSAECTNLFNVLSALEPPLLRAHVFERVLPFELDVLRARCVYWAGDYGGYLDAMAALLKRCRMSARRARTMGDSAMWTERAARMCLIIASQLVEMKDFTAATALLEPLCASPSSSSELRSAIARIYLQAGFTAQAERHFSIVAADPVVEPAMKYANATLLAAACGDWAEAAAGARRILGLDSGDVVAINNLAVALLSEGKLKEGIAVLESALQASPSAVTVAEPFLFNLSTLYELRAALATEKKRDLLIEVAKWSGDGLKTACLKMSSS